MPGFSAEVAHSLDCAVEGGDVTADAYLYLLAVHPDPDGWHNGLYGQGDYFAAFRASSRQALAAWRAEAGLRERAAVTWAGVDGLPRFLVDSARATLTEATKRCAVPGGFDVDLAARLVADPEFAAAHAKPFLPSVSEIALRAGEDIRIMGLDAFRAARAELDGLYRAAERRRMETVRAEVPGPAAVREPKRVRKARRRPLRRSVEFLAAIAGAKRARAFVTGDDVLVEGKRFDFRVRKGVLSSNGHGGMNITVTDKDSVEIADLCFYFRDMPAADQLAALVMHVQSGEEDGILRAANVIRAHPGASSNADLARISRTKEEEKRAALGLDCHDDDPFGMLRHIDMAAFDGVKGASRVYNELHDELVPVAMRTTLGCAFARPEGRLLLAAATDLEDRLAEECRTFVLRSPAALALPDGEAEIDRTVDALPSQAGNAVWDSLLDRFEPPPDPVPAIACA